MTKADLAPVKEEVDPNDPLGLMGPKYVPKTELKDIMREEIRRSVIIQAKSLRWHRKLITRFRTWLVSQWYEFAWKYGLKERPIVNDSPAANVFADACSCTCPRGEKYGALDRHVEKEFNGFKYLICRNCAEVTGGAAGICHTDAPWELACNVAEALRQGEEI